MNWNYRPFTLLIALLLPLVAFSQEEPVDQDTTIYKVVEVMPRFPGCEQLDTTLAVLNECAQASLLNFIYQNVRYPLEARQQNIEGTVVLTFVVEKDGTISNLQVIKDIGGGCAGEALRVVGAMNEIGIRWKPGLQGGEVKRVQFNLPVRFRLEEPLPYVFIQRDTVYVELESEPAFQGGEAGLTAFIDANLKYPSFAYDSCWVGDMDVSILIYPDASIKVLDTKDYNNLGFDFQFEAIQVTTATDGRWEPGRFEGRAVPAVYEFNLAFYSDNPACRLVISDYKRANQLADEGLELFNQGEKEQGMAKMTEAVELFPENANFRYIRGQAYLSENQLDAACKDLQMVKQVLFTSFVDELLPVICKE